MKNITSQEIRQLRQLTGAGIMECRKALEHTDGDCAKAADYLKKVMLETANKREDRATLEGKVFTARKGGILTAVTLNCETDFVASNKVFNETGELCASTALDLPTLPETNMLTELTSKMEPAIREAVARIKENIRLTKVSRIKAGADAELAVYNHNGNQIISAVTYKLSGSSGKNNLAGLINDITLQIAACEPLFVDSKSVPEEYISGKMKEFAREFEESGKPLKLKERIISGKLQKHLKQVCLLDQEYIKDSSLTIGKLIKRETGKANVAFEVTGILFQSVRHE